jgi:hypothetical protein
LAREKKKKKKLEPVDSRFENGQVQPAEKFGKSFGPVCMGIFTHRPRAHTNWAPQNDNRRPQRLQPNSPLNGGRWVYVGAKVIRAERSGRNGRTPPSGCTVTPPGATSPWGSFLSRLAAARADGLEPPWLGFSEERNRARRVRALRRPPPGVSSPGAFACAGLRAWSGRCGLLAAGQLPPLARTMGSATLR